MASAYGAAGALIVILLWVYYSAQIFLLGAEFTKAYSDLRGTEAQPPWSTGPGQSHFQPSRRSDPR